LRRGCEPGDRRIVSATCQRQDSAVRTDQDVKWGIRGRNAELAQHCCRGQINGQSDPIRLQGRTHLAGLSGRDSSRHLGESAVVGESLRGAFQCL